MRCDDVFEILTSGPFPSGAISDAAVERHLAACHECRKFAEALRPLDGATETGLPAYAGCLSNCSPCAEPVDLVDQVQTLVNREQKQRATRARSRISTGLGPLITACAAVFLLGAAAALAGPMLAAQWSSGSSEMPLGQSEEHAQSNGSNVCGSEVLTYIKQRAEIPVSERDANDSCCLQCHGGGERAVFREKSRLHLVVMSCQKCHTERQDWARM